MATAVEDIEPLTLEVLEAWRVGKPQQVAGRKDCLAKPEGIGGMDIALDDIVVHQAVNDIVGFVFSRTDHERIGQKMAHIDKGVGTDTLLLTKVFKRVTGMERIHGDFKFLAITGGMEGLTRLAVDPGQ